MFAQLTCTNEQESQQFIKDVSDGSIYKNLLKSVDRPAFYKREAFSFMINTDGITPCKKSKITIWIIFFINIILLADRRRD